MKTLTIALVASLVAMLATVGCGSSSEADDRGTPPAIKDLSFDKTEIAKGSLETLEVTLAYSDAEGDVAKVYQQLLPKEGTSTAPNELTLDGAAGQKQGTHAFALQMAAPRAGEVDVTFWLVDARGNESERATRTITIK